MKIAVNSKVTILVNEFEKTYVLSLQVEKETNPRKLGGVKGLNEYPKEGGIIKALRSFIDSRIDIIMYYQLMGDANRRRETYRRSTSYQYPRN